MNEIAYLDSVYGILRSMFLTTSHKGWSIFRFRKYFSEYTTKLL